MKLSKKRPKIILTALSAIMALGLMASLSTFAASSKATPFYRYWNAPLGDHFYTVDRNDKALKPYGYGYEKVEGYVFRGQEPGTTPLYRYWNPAIRDHFYTIDRNDAGLAAYGYAFERAEAHVYRDQEAGTTPLYRYWNPTIGDHFYTVDRNDAGLAAYGYTFERAEAHVYRSKPKDTDLAKTRKKYAKKAPPAAPNAPRPTVPANRPTARPNAPTRPTAPPSLATSWYTNGKGYASCKATKRQACRLEGNSVYSFVPYTADYQTSDVKAGSYDLRLAYHNAGNLSLPAKYGFKVKVKVNGKNAKTYTLAAPKKGEVKTQKLPVKLNNGRNTISVEWTNDYFKKNKYDANFAINSLAFGSTVGEAVPNPNPAPVAPPAGQPNETEAALEAARNNQDDAGLYDYQIANAASGHYVVKVTPKDGRAVFYEIVTMVDGAWTSIFTGEYAPSPEDRATYNVPEEIGNLLPAAPPGATPPDDGDQTES